MAWRILYRKSGNLLLTCKRPTALNGLISYLPPNEFSFKQVPCHFIHNSSPKNALPPILLIALRPIVKVSAMLFGRSIRKWWQKLPPDKRLVLLKKVKARQTQIAAGFTVLAGIGFLFYLEHIEEDPITKRKRFILYTEDQMKGIADLEFESQIAEFSAEIVPPSNSIYRRVVRVANRILQANVALPQVKNKDWAVTVVDRPDVTNAFVLPNGKIVIFTGILNVASNDDQLAIVLSHEISHALLQHMTENLSKAFFVEMVLVIPLVIIWALLPDVAALFSQWLSSRLADIMIHLPFSRAIEREADVVGLELAARACFDVREAPVFWGKMRQVNESSEPLEWLSTHPSNEARQIDLSHLVPAAIDVRSNCHCPRLPPLTRAQLYYYRTK